MARDRFDVVVVGSGSSGGVVAYIRAARKQPNFTLRAGAMVDRVLFDGTRATGVRYVDGGGRAVEVEADLVVLSAGVYSTPPILQRSGMLEEAEKFNRAADEFARRL